MLNLVLMIWAQLPCPEPVFVEFKDNQFKSRMLFDYDINDDGQIDIDEAAAATGSFVAFDLPFENLTGLDAFINLESVWIERIPIEFIPDLSPMVGMHTLRLNRCGLQSIKGVPPNLVELALTRNRFSHLPQLPSSLEMLYLTDNLISNLSSVANLTNLRRLYCGTNPIDELPGFDATPQLEILIASACPISELPALSSTLTTLDVSSTDISGVLPPLPSSLVTLDVSNTTISEIQNLSDLINLVTVDASDADLLSLLGLGAQTNLEVLKVSGNSLTEIPMLSALVSLKNLDCSHNLIAEVLGLSSLTMLQEVRISNNQITIMPDFSLSPNLRILEAAENGLANFSGLINNLDLEWIDLSSNSFLTVPDLTLFDRLEMFNISNNQLTTLPLLPPNLEVLDASHNQIAALSTLPIGLKELLVSDNQITALGPFNNQLLFLDCSHNQLSTVPEVTYATDLYLNDNLIQDITPLAQEPLFSGRLRVQNNQLDSSDCAQIAELSTRSWIEFEYKPQLLNPDFDCPPDPGGPVLVPDLFPDQRFRNSLRSTYGSQATASDLAAVTTLSRQNTNISDITGISYFSNLEHLDLFGNEIEDAAEIESLTQLEFLDLGNNNLQTLPSLINHEALIYLRVGSNNLTQLDDLPPNMTNLQANNNSIHSLLGLPPSIRTLNLNTNQVMNLEALTGLPVLSDLDISFNLVSELPVLPTSLEYLRMFGNQIHFIEPVTTLLQLRSLRCGSNLIVQLPNLASHTSLTVIDASHNCISEMGSIPSDLTLLNLGHNFLSNVAPIATSDIDSANLEMNDLYEDQCLFITAARVPPEAYVTQNHGELHCAYCGDLAYSFLEFVSTWPAKGVNCGLPDLNPNGRVDVIELIHIVACSN